MTQASVITDAMRAEIGKESDPVTFEVDKTACRMFARAVGYTDPIYFDEEYARSKGYRGIPAPVGFLGHDHASTECRCRARRRRFSRPGCGRWSR